MKTIQKINLILMAIAFGIIVLGFALMIGEPSGATEYNPDIFSVRRITVGPMIALFGFVMMLVGILYRPKNKQS
ncbi:MAG: DUF3098 domain-containing protein [Paludibacteraceae bacterium]|nr:DUF3098 domain-containing protein [Paludibacteraceae bacterium]